MAGKQKVQAKLTEARLLRMSEKNYMNDAQLAFFRDRLLRMKAELASRAVEFAGDVRENEFLPDPNDRATLEEEMWRDARLREREAMMMRKIDAALERIRTKEYGYCEKTGEPIGLRRLLARPTASTAVTVKQLDERIEAGYARRQEA